MVTHSRPLKSRAATDTPPPGVGSSREDEQRMRRCPSRLEEEPAGSSVRRWAACLGAGFAPPARLATNFRMSSRDISEISDCFTDITFRSMLMLLGMENVIYVNFFTRRRCVSTNAGLCTFERVAGHNPHRGLVPLGVGAAVFDTLTERDVVHGPVHIGAVLDRLIEGLRHDATPQPPPSSPETLPTEHPKLLFPVASRRARRCKN